MAEGDEFKQCNKQYTLEELLVMSILEDANGNPCFNICGTINVAGGGATEATLLDVLGAIQDHQEIELGMVVDTGNGDTIVSRRLIYDEELDSFSIEYFEADGTPYVITGPLEFTDEYLKSLDSKDFATETTLSSRLSELTFITFISALDSAVDGLLSNSNGVSDTDNDAITTFLLNKIGGKAVDTATYSPAYTADDAAMSAIDKDNGAILVNQGNLAIDEDEVLNHPGATSSNFGMPDKFVNEDVDETAAVSVKAGAGTVYGWNIVNGGNQPIYVKFYNEAAGSVTVGTTSVETIVMVPSNGSVYQSPDNRKLYCDSEISVAVTGGQADNDTTAPAGIVRVEIDYK